MNMDAPLPQIPDTSDPSLAFDPSPGSIESSPLQAPEAAPPATPELLSPPDFNPTPLAGADGDPAEMPSPMPATNNAAADEAHPPPGTVMEEEPVAFDPAVIAALANDPVKRRELEHAHSLAKDMFYTTVDKVYSMLSAATVPRSAASAPHERTGPTHIRMLMVAQRQGEMLSKERRMVAEGIVVGSLMNIDNPQWNPSMPETGKTTSPSAMATLLRMEL
ncbi:hypothetical protein RY831_00415 [Noviherbaspirillum sp. CPCC 100848]|uniref:Uncharacterized protein n=1 Tax=Noviherbaspirillum album TaxID=3080276 RepID=A0ABU6J1X4_9BURK|nr:hypothetical protein [Noviherbaspirillum sp. CPCC 100848]MEC4717604.1 hypothetical protein [Noviherbaspirillum sp. CPCC 100848]